MFRLTLAQMRRSIPRLVAAGLAIAIGTAFIAATLLAGGVMDRTGRDAVTARYAQADVVVNGALSPDELDAVRTLPGVEAADLFVDFGVELRTDQASRWQLMLPVVTDERLTPLRITEGRAPAAAGEVALPAATAEDLGIAVGDGLEAVYQTEVEQGWEDVTQPLTLVGVSSDPRGAWTEVGGAGLATLEDGGRWNRVEWIADAMSAQAVVVGADGADDEALRAQVAEILPGVDVITRDVAAERQLAELGGGDEGLVAVVLGFAAIALVVAALVISNTFQVLVAQRTRTLALLRAVGARRGQLRASVVTEATILGLASSAAGIAAGIALAQGMLTVLRRTDIEAPLPATVALTWQVLLVPLLVGTAVTLLASLVPARAATQVTAIEALRPLDAPTVHRVAGATRLGFAIALTALGALLLGMATATIDDAMTGLAVGLLGGTLSFVGVLLGAVFWVPPIVRLAQRALRGLGPVARLASANTVRNPRRTAATSTALLIGVTLVVLMSTGAASARATLDQTLDEQFPVDMTLTPTSSPADALTDDVVSKVAAVQGVAALAEVRTAQVDVSSPERASEIVTVWAIDPADATTVLRNEALSGPLADGTVLIGSPFQSGTVELEALDPSGEPTGTVAHLPAQRVAGIAYSGLVTPATMDQIAPLAVADTLFVSLDEDANAAEVLQDVRDALADASLYVESPAAQRAQFDQVINVLLAVVIGLLGVAVVIALLGVANTLSLSVLERRRESATLRAIGLSRRRLRATLAVEGMIIAGVGAVLGSILGVVYGWAGATTVLQGMGDVTLAVPWREIAMVVAVALVAGLLASVVPARSAARTPPVAALAEE